MKQNRKKKATPEESLRASCEKGMGVELDYTRVRERLDVEAITRAGAGRKAVAASLPHSPVSSRRSAAATVCLVLAVLILIPAVAVGSFVIARFTMDPVPPDEYPDGTVNGIPPSGTDPDMNFTPGDPVPVTPRPMIPNASGEAWNNLFDLSESYSIDNALFLRAEHLDTAMTDGILPAVLTVNDLSAWQQFCGDSFQDVTQIKVGSEDLTADFFVNHSLQIIITEGRSGSIRYRLEEIYATNGKAHRAWELVAQVPPALTMDIVHWCIVIPVSKAEAQMPMMELSMRDEPMWDVVAPDDVITDIIIRNPDKLWFNAQSYVNGDCLFGGVDYSDDYDEPSTWIVNTLAEWQSLYLGCAAGSVSDGGFTEGLAALDEAFFAEKSLLILRVSEGSGSYRHRVDGVAVEGEALRVTLTTLYHEMDTCDMAAWAILIPIDKAYSGLPVELVTRSKPDMPQVTVTNGYVYGNTIHGILDNSKNIGSYSFPFGQTVDSVQTYQAAVRLIDDPDMPTELRRAMNSFDEAFFEEKALLILYLKNEPDEVHYEVESLTIQDGPLLHVGVSGRYSVEVNVPSLGGSYRVILMPVDKELANLNVAVYTLK